MIKNRIEKYKEDIQSERYDKELYDSCIVLRNLAIVQADKPMSADYVYEQLLMNCKYLKPLYVEMLTLYRKGEDKEAYMAVYSKFSSRQGKTFTRILSKLDKINPVELLEQVNAFMDSMSEIRMTAQYKKTDRNSVITTMIATVTMFALIMNFAVVVVFMDTINNLNSIF